MALSIDLSPELEARLRTAAAREGLGAEEYVLASVQERLGETQAHRSGHLGDREAFLLESINRGLSQETWERYHELVERRRSEALSTEEQRELIAISDRIEALNAERINYLVQLADLRGTGLRSLMAGLRIEAPPYA